jgi:hypothetical protein
MQQEMVGMLGRDSFTKLLQCPGRRRMFRDIDVQEAAGGMFHEHKDVEEAESRRDHHTEVACNDGLGMIAHKGPPALGLHASAWSTVPSLRHVFAQGIRLRRDS